MSVRVMLADDHDLVRAGFRALLERDADLEVVAEATDGATVLDAIGRCRPHVVVLDITLPGVNGIDLTHRITAEHPAVVVLAVSVHGHRRYVQAMLKAGARGYLTKRAAGHCLLEAVRAVAGGQRYLDPTAAVALAEEFAPAPEAAAGKPELAERERQVLQMLAEGRTSKQIAAALDVSTRTIDASRQRLMETLGLHTVADLVRYAIREGITPLDT